MSRQLDVPDDLVKKLQDRADRYGNPSWEDEALEALAHWVSGKLILSDDDREALWERKRRAASIPAMEPDAFARWKRDNGW